MHLDFQVWLSYLYISFEPAGIARKKGIPGQSHVWKVWPEPTIRAG